MNSNWKGLSRTDLDGEWWWAVYAPAGGVTGVTLIHSFIQSVSQQQRRTLYVRISVQVAIAHKHKKYNCQFKSHYGSSNRKDYAMKMLFKEYNLMNPVRLNDTTQLGK
ncbi:unnamed protein product [Schistosoma margrebowiei]|uniref:Uncharacterized protein n=1 Tax=Schistosoma margrebowiei TaxID=48269 RepID=A0A183M5T2_9TREM|nr:unnamed protein product [Schistosoma margrebowiei]